MRAISPRFRAPGRRATASRRRSRAQAAARLRQRFGVAVGLSVAEHIGPGAVAPDGGAAGRACNWRGSGPAARRRRCPPPRGRSRAPARARDAAILGIARAPAGDADIDRGRGRSLDVPILVLFGVAESHPDVAPWNWCRDLGCLRRHARRRTAANEPTAPRHPARRATSIDGRSPGSRVSAFAAFPGIPSGSVARARRLQLRGQPRIWGVPRTAFPVRSHPRDRRYAALNGGQRRLCQCAVGNGAACEARADGYSPCASSVPARCGT